MAASMIAAGESVAVAWVGVVSVTVAGAWGAVNAFLARKAIHKETRPNGGSSMRDAVDRIEAALEHQVVPRLDRGAEVMADHADRLAALEARLIRDPNERTRKDDPQ